MNETARRGQAAKVDVVANQPRNATVTSQEAFIAQNEGKVQETREEVAAEGVVGTATHNRPGTVIMYKPTERSGWLPRTVSASAISFLFKQGWRDTCPDCNGHHVDRQGRVTTDPNACSAKEPVAVRVCPVCRKRIYDNRSLSEAVIEDDDDPNVIRDDPYSSVEPAQRTKLKLDLHLWVRHPEWAQANGVPPLPTAFKEMVETPMQRGT